MAGFHGETIHPGEGRRSTATHKHVAAKQALFKGPLNAGCENADGVRAYMANPPPSATVAMMRRTAAEKVTGSGYCAAQAATWLRASQ